LKKKSGFLRISRHLNQTPTDLCQELANSLLLVIVRSCKHKEMFNYYWHDKIRCKFFAVFSTGFTQKNPPGLFIYLFIHFFCAQGTQFPRAVNIEKKMKHVWKCHGADSEIGNVSARQAALNRWTATDKHWKRKTVSRGSFI